MVQKYYHNLGLLFSDVAKRNPEHIALKYPDGTNIQYEELETLSNKIAWYFIDNGLKKGDLIAIFNNKSTFAFATMLACLKTGIIYTNLDVSSPFSRLQKILTQARPVWLINDFSDLAVVQELSQDLQIPVVSWNEDTIRLLGTYSEATLPHLRWVTGANPAYLMFTSGSTGFPKGAVISHQNLLNFIQWGQETFNVDTTDVFTNVNPIYFDNSVFDFYVSLFSGATLVPFSTELSKDPHQLVLAAEATACTSWFSVPSMLVYLLTTKAIIPGRLPAIKKFIFGGEGFPKPKLKALYDAFKDTATLYNVYGPTECTCICSSYVIGPEDFDDLLNLAPLGYLAPNFDYEILIEAPSDVANLGELALKGPNVGLGYYNDPERTANSFIQNPNNSSFLEIVYKTGDLVEVDGQGYLHFRGRCDNQIKHMGYRIELEEVEAAFNSLEYVNESAVVYKKIGPGLGRILAYVSLTQPVVEKELHHQVGNLLPEYMVPHKIRILDHLPKNQNGKIDRTVLQGEA